MAKQDTFFSCESLNRCERIAPSSCIAGHRYSVPQTRGSIKRAPGRLKVHSTRVSRCKQPRINQTRSRALRCHLFSTYFSTERKIANTFTAPEDLSPSEKQEYVDNLAESTGRAIRTSDVPEFINSYIRLKSTDIRAAAKNSAWFRRVSTLPGGAVSILADWAVLFNSRAVGHRTNTRLEQGQGKVGDTQHEVAKMKRALYFAFGIPRALGRS